MIKSMTGFGRSMSALKGGTITVEIKTVNHKFFDLSAKLPNHLSLLEDRIKEVVQKKIRRGKINLGLIYDGPIEKREKVSVNETVAKHYYHALLRLKRSLGTKEEVALSNFIALPGVLTYEVREESLVKLWPKVRAALEAALERLDEDRMKEGNALYRDVIRRADRIEKLVKAIKARSATSVEEYRKKFNERIRELSGGQRLDDSRLAVEVAIYAKNCDIAEETTRLENHIANLRSTLRNDTEAGKKLDFIAQELHREINTTGSKANDFKIAKSVIEVKSEIEKIREQVKNVE